MSDEYHYDFDIDIEDTPCPKCGEYEVCSRPCDSWNCDDGYCDEYEDDPINFAPGELYTRCDECLGYGILRWCRKCGCDLNAQALKKAKHSGRE